MFSVKQPQLDITGLSGTFFSRLCLYNYTDEAKCFNE